MRPSAQFNTSTARDNDNQGAERAQDGEEVRPSERILALRALPELRARLDADLRAAGVDPRDAARVSDDSLGAEADTAETGCAPCAGCGSLPTLDWTHAGRRRTGFARSARARCCVLLSAFLDSCGAPEYGLWLVLLELGLSSRQPMRARCLRPCGVTQYVPGLLLT
jgi:hypothetical protein